MAEIWGALAVAGATAAIGVYSANKQAKAAEQANAAGAAALANRVKVPELEPVNFPDMPGYMPVNFNNLQRGAIKTDELAYNRSDVDFARRHPGLTAAEKMFEKSVRRDQKGEHELMPALQNEFVTAGLEGALDSFGDTGPILRPGSAGEADVARNLGLSIAAFQDRNRANRERSLALAEELFPRREFGLTGQNRAEIKLQNAQGANASTQASHAQDIQELQYNQRIKELNVANLINQGNVDATGQAALAQSQGQADAAKTAAYAQIATGAISGLSNAYGRYAGSKTRNPYAATTNDLGWKANARGV